MLDNRYCWNKGVTTGEMKSSPRVLGYSYDGKQFNTIVVIVIIITHEFVWEKFLLFSTFKIDVQPIQYIVNCNLKFAICNVIEIIAEMWSKETNWLVPFLIPGIQCFNLFLTTVFFRLIDGKSFWQNVQKQSKLWKTFVVISFERADKPAWSNICCLKCMLLSPEIHFSIGPQKSLFFSFSFLN